MVLICRWNRKASDRGVFQYQQIALVQSSQCTRRRSLFDRCGQVLGNCRGPVAGLLCALAFLAGLSSQARSADNGPGPVASPAQSAATSTPGANPNASKGNTAASAADTPDAISGNPAAAIPVPGTGLMGRLLGLDPAWGVNLGGVWVGDTDYLFTGGVKPRSWSFNSMLLLNLNLDGEKLLGLPGSSITAAMLQFNGEAANNKAGAVTGYDSLPGLKPLVRTELYRLDWRQNFFKDKLIVVVGKSVPTSDFNNVSRPLVTREAFQTIPAVTGLSYTPIFINPTLLGVAPGYYDSAYGILVNIAPTSNFYFSYGIYDGALATGVQTGLDAAPVFNGHYFTIGEAGYGWLLGRDELPGKFAVGGWAQTGKLYGPGVTQEGSQGLYTLGSQRIWYRDPGVDNSGVSCFYQFGFNDSNTLIANRYFGLGLTAFGLVPNRPVDSIGGGLAWSWLNRRYGFRSNEAILQTYYQLHLIGPTFFQPAISYMPNPGANPQVPGAVAMTAQLTILF